MTQKILAIDDHPQTLDIVIITLQRHGFRAIGSNAPLQAISLAEQEQPDLVLLDMNMPGINGKELCRQFRAHPKFREIPIIMFSAEASEKLASFQVGADDFLVKPTDPDELIARIETLLRRASGADGTKASTPSVSPGAGAAADAQREDTQPPTISPQRPLDRRMIAVLGVRGGSGTTTLAINLAFSAAELGYTTTLVDLDTLQGHVGLYLKAKAIGGVNALSGLKDNQLRQQIPGMLLRQSEKLHLLLTKPNLDDRHSRPSADQAAIMASALMQQNQCVVADLGHEITGVTRAILDGADQVIVCLRSERVSLSIARALLGGLKRSLYDHTSLRIVLVGTVGGMNLPRNAVERFLGHRLLAMIPALPKEMMQAMNNGVAFVQLYPKASLTQLYRRLARRLVVS
jgi:two-component system OmpR family response regulator